MHNNPAASNMLSKHVAQAEPAHLRRMTSHVARLLYGSMPLLGSSRNTTAVGAQKQAST
jgi:hypothetical protein